MSNISIDFREGTTEPVNITLMDGSSAANITGYGSVSIFLRSEDGATQVEKTTPTDVAVVSASGGTITVTFGASDLLFSKVQYRGYIIVVDGTGKRTSFPSNGEIVFKMRERFSGDG
jgi:hypothetical protein